VGTYDRTISLEKDLECNLLLRIHSFQPWEERDRREISNIGEREGELTLEVWMSQRERRRKKLTTNKYKRKKQVEE